MGRKTVELRAISSLEDGSEAVQTGIYVFEDTTIAQIRNLMSNGVNNMKVDRVEFDAYDKGGEE